MVQGRKQILFFFGGERPKEEKERLKRRMWWWRSTTLLSYVVVIISHSPYNTQEHNRGQHTYQQRADAHFLTAFLWAPSDFWFDGFDGWLRVDHHAACEKYHEENVHGIHRHFNADVRFSLLDCFISSLGLKVKKIATLQETSLKRNMHPIEKKNKKHSFDKTRNDE